MTSKPADDIPSELLETARATARLYESDGVCRPYDDDGRGDCHCSPGPCKGGVQSIARALLAEQQRCARLAAEAYVERTYIGAPGRDVLAARAEEEGRALMQLFNGGDDGE